MPGAKTAVASDEDLGENLLRQWDVYVRKWRMLMIQTLSGYSSLVCEKGIKHLDQCLVCLVASMFSAPCVYIQVIFY